MAENSRIAIRQRKEFRLLFHASLRTVGRIACLAVWALLFVSWLSGAADAQWDGVRINTVDGQELIGKIESISPRGKISGNFQPAADSLQLAEVLTISTGKEAKSSSRPIYVVPVSGGRVGVDGIAINEDQARLTIGSSTIKLPLQTVRAVVWKDSPTIKQLVKAPSKENDSVVVDVNDQERTVEGLLESLTEQSVGINYQNESRTISLGKLKALVMADLGFSAPTGSAATLTMNDGSQWQGVIASLSGDQVTLSLTSSAAIDLPLSKLVQVAIRSDRLQYLSDLQPMEARERSDFVVQRSWKKDRSVEGNRLQIRDAEGTGVISFQRGIGVQSRSELVFANERQFDRFRAIVGIDIETEGRGDCEVAVRGDGIELWKARVTASSPPQPIDLDIAGIEQLTLVVMPGREFDLADHLDWGNARLLKTKD